MRMARRTGKDESPPRAEGGGAPRSGSARRQADGERGVTILELAIVVFLIGLAFLAAFPFMKSSFQAVQANGSAREIYTDLAMTRTLAIKEQLPFLVEFCDDPPGYVIMRCDNGSGAPDAGDFTTAPCDGSIGVCGTLGSTTILTDPDVIRQVNLGGGKSSTGGSPLGLARVRFGMTGAIGSSTPYSCSPAPCASSPPGSGVQLADCDAAADPDNRRFYFHWRGRTAKDGAAGQPCQGALYLTGRFAEDEAANRAVEFTTVGSLRTYRWDPEEGTPRWE